MRRIAAFTKYDRAAASTRYRILQYEPALRNAGYDLCHFPLLGNDYVASLVSGRKPDRLVIAAAYARRLAQLLSVERFDALWVYAELFPYLPAAAERLIFRSGKPVIYDCDDAFSLTYDQHHSRLVRRSLGRKLEPLVSGAAASCCGNPFLREWASRLNSRTMLLPTVVNTDLYRPAERQSHPLTIGWIGSPTTWPYLQRLLPLLRRLVQRFGIEIRVVGAGAAAAPDMFAGLSLRPWREEAEIAEVQGFDIGIMPLEDGPFEQGKSGFKLIQYMACGLPVVASPVGVNREIVTAEVGRLASSEEGWEAALTQLIEDEGLRRSLGEAGRRRAVADYSLAVHAPRLVALFQDVVGSR